MVREDDSGNLRSRRSMPTMIEEPLEEQEVDLKKSRYNFELP
jgi:hypothetical protein